MNAVPAAGTRTIERTLEIQAQPEAVWAALTDAAELTRWFGLSANVKPGTGGTIRVAWGEGGGFDSRIEAWDPPRFLRTSEWTSSPGAEPKLICTDWHIEAKSGGTTVLRMVQSGFGRGTGWDDTYDSYSGGWTFELRSMRHYLEHHLGASRQVAFVSAALPTGVSPADAVTRALGTEWLGARGTTDGLSEGESYRLQAADGTPLTGKVLVPRSPKCFAGTLDGVGNGLWRIETECGSGYNRIWIWFAAWGDGNAPVIRTWQRAVEAAVDRFGWDRTPRRA
ncbi:MAG: SRPBCC domain-containing protein [Phycisphaeraceae bacterium]|nr:SRPBCC domain-containing protein [Phycisphaeraceae bacterium]